MKERDEFDTWQTDKFCVRCGRKTERRVERATYDPKTGDIVYHCVMTCPAPWWRRIFSWHAGDRVHLPY